LGWFKINSFTVICVLFHDTHNTGIIAGSDIRECFSKRFIGRVVDCLGGLNWKLSSPHYAQKCFRTSSLHGLLQLSKHKHKIQVLRDNNSASQTE